MKLEALTRSGLPVETIALARFLIGAMIVHDLPEGRVAGRIVETEAYLSDDAASHSFRGETPRNRPMFGERGYAYVYLNYGMYWLFNISSETRGTGAGVLVRAVEPVLGEALMAARRPGKPGAALTNGPGKLTAAMGIGPQHSGGDLCVGGPLHLAARVRPAGEICVSTRIGITRSADLPLRFFERDNLYVSGPKRLRSLHL